MLSSNGGVASTIIKEENRRNVLKCIYNLRRCTQPLVSQNLELSRPTVTQLLNDLTKEGHVLKQGHAESTGGRKANMYLFNSSKKVAIGLELLADRYELIAIDLYGDMLKYEKKNKTFSHTDTYYDTVSDSVNRFIHGLELAPETILGVGIALQALISSDGKSVVYGKILGCTGLEITAFTERIPYRCIFNHDAESLANIELWKDPTVHNAIFFNVRDNLSGAVIIDGDFIRGGELKSGVFEHMTMIPDGLSCYCGKKGCVNTYCSLSALLKQDEDIDLFFQELRAGKESYKKRWEKYLRHLAMIIDNLHMFISSDVILGGTLSKYLIEEDTEKIKNMINKRSAFPSHERYIKISCGAAYPLCHGAAIPLLNEYLKKIMR